MAWPLSALTTYVAGTTPKIKASDLNDIQDAIVRLYGATWSIKSLYIDGIGGTVVAPAKGRLYVTGGTALVGGDFGLGAGWGATASVTAVEGYDAAGRVTIQANGAGIAADPTVTLNFKDGSYGGGRFFVWLFNSSQAAAAGTTCWHNTGVLASPQWTFKHTPNAADTYAFQWLVIGGA